MLGTCGHFKTPKFQRNDIVLIIASTDDCCTFCREEIKTIKHVIVNCKHILPLWKNLSMLILRNTGKIKMVKIFKRYCLVKFL